MRSLCERGTRFLVAPHSFKNVGKQNILARLIRLTINCASLRAERFLQIVLSQLDQRNQVQRFRVVHVQPARVRQSGISAGDVAGFRVKPAQRNSRAVVPPMFARKFFN